ncbi:uncharacterized protein LOC126176227 [Schistocerca cancellata]|uniref:uncharacterized protein LOC126176227 n=1 Tax=Schistocerca cancellata TaxID=274614 RepID=UPI002117EA55|nr:uncharacterized protein LOC126176227 [Schistocerca cancellata]
MCTRNIVKGPATMKNVVDIGYVAVLISYLVLILESAISAKVTVFPTYPVKYAAGQDFYLKIVDPIVNLQGCVVNVTGNIIPLLEAEQIEKSGGYEYFGGGLESGECGVRATQLQKEQSGNWTLMATNSTDTYSGSLIVTVTDVPSHVDEGGTLILGETGTVRLGPSLIVHCRMIHPSGKEVGTMTGVCSTRISIVRKEDAGRWSAIYTMSGSMQEFTASAVFNVIEAEKHGLKTIVQASKSIPGAIDILCRLSPSSSSAQCTYCNFVHPNGTGFLMQEGLGNGQYVYFGDGLNSKYKDCGLTILEPMESDSGIWKCELGLDATLQVRDGGYIFLQQRGEDKFPVIQATAYSEETVMLNGSSTVLGCTVPFMIKGCWLRHPNGEVISVLPDKTFSQRYRYSGDSFGLGQCLIRLNVYVEDSGQWDCNVALDGSKTGDISVPFRVHVKANKLSVERKIIDAANGDSTLLYCYSTQHQQPLDMCHFIRPDGRGLTLDGSNRVIEGRYSYFGNGLDLGDCGLHITSVTAQDYGQWTCSVNFLSAALENIVNTEHIQVNQKGPSGSAIAGASVGAIVGVAFVIAGGCFIIHKRRRMHQSPLSFRYQNNDSHRSSNSS